MPLHMLPAALFIWAISHIGSVHGEDSTPTAAAPRAVVTPHFSFNAIPEMQTCTSVQISWVYSPVDGEEYMTLDITNDNVAQPSAPSLTATTTGTFNSAGARALRVYQRDVLTESISDGYINPSAHSYTWDSVNVTAGWYALVASFPITDSNVTSASFYVVNGSDTSCLGTVASSSSTSTQGSSTSATSTSASSGAGSTSTSVTLPVNAASSSKVNRGAIAGGVIGGLAVIAAAIAAYFYLRYASAASRASPRKRTTRKWGGLGSVDSKTNAYPSAPRASRAADRHHSQSSSVGPMLDDTVYVIGNVGIESRPSRINDGLGLEAEDEVNSYFSPSQEKFTSPTHGSAMRPNPFSDSGHIDDDVPMDLISSAPGQGVTRNSSSTSSYMNNNFSRPRSHPSSPYSGSPTTPTESPFSIPAANATSSTLNHPDVPSSYVPSSYAPSPSPAYPSGSSQDAAAPPAARRSPTGEAIVAGGSARRTPRKPVPQYNPTDPALASPPLPSRPPLPAAAESDSSREGSIRSGDWPNLTHKASFGAEGRAVHYLIPDMPAPQRD
ncbi:hypothetical protein DFH07DRAFT_591123 [Mycena maculata]|uniref:Uncharacterized protein n=1 Tax=Mycena maculata TaxID=230809 RepID=A0AAD7IQ73_9AGAR|nr:hypothetical protein DFH07DRAFT_591123 [Mycena maculata]